MGVSPSVGAGFPTREGCSGFAGSMTNMDIVLSPALAMKRNCMIVSKLESQRKAEFFTFSETTTESWEGPNRLASPLPPVAVRTGFDNVPSVSEIWRAMTLFPAGSSS